MKSLRKNPHLYEIHLMPWLNHLSERVGQRVTLKNIPLQMWTDLKAKGMDLVWLMGMWHRSKDACAKARNETRLIDECHSILDHFSMDDLVGSPYAVDHYIPDLRFGNQQDLLRIKESLADLNFKLILDFVPNHTACDHPWIKNNPNYYVHVKTSEGAKCRKGFFQPVDGLTGSCIAHGKDPYFDPWKDTAQVDFSNSQAVTAMAETLSDLTPYCHGLRCDMAMLVLNKIFTETWRPYLKKPVGTEFWKAAIDRLRNEGRSCLLIAEAYWNLEKELLDLGFDFAYDKVFYDLLVKEDVNGLKVHLSQPVDKQEKMVRFLENHDEPRAMKVFGLDRIYSAMVTHATVPGMRLFHHGQFSGNRARIPVQLGRSPEEPVQQDLHLFSEKLLQEVDQPVFHDGSWGLCNIYGCGNTPHHQNLIAWYWKYFDERRLIVVNLKMDRGVGMVTLPLDWLPKGEPLIFIDPIKGDEYIRSTMQVATSGLYVELKGRDFHFFKILRK